MPLINQHCEACNASTPKVAGSDLAELLRQLNGSWELEDEKLHRRFKFPDFVRAFTFATGIALLAESEGHHPDMHVGWGYVAVDLTTHAVHGLSRNDFVLAAKIDSLECIEAFE